MQSKRNRLQQKGVIQAILSQGKWLNDRYFTIKYQRSAEKLPAQFAIIVSKKIDKRATVRNRVKRQISEACQRVLKKLTPGIQMVIIPRATVKTLEFAKMAESIETLLNKIN